MRLRLSRRADEADDPPRAAEGGGDPGLPGPLRQPRNADALMPGHGRGAGDGGLPDARGPAEGDRPRGADDTVDAVSIRRFFRRVAGVEGAEPTAEATIVQTRHRIPETSPSEGRILVCRAPSPEPLRFLDPRETETRLMRALGDCGPMHVKLHEDVARHGRIATSCACPVKVGAATGWIRRRSRSSAIRRCRTARPSSSPARGGSGGSARSRPTRWSAASTSRAVPSRGAGRGRMRALRRCGEPSRRGGDRRRGRADVRLPGHRTVAARGARPDLSARRAKPGRMRREARRAAGTRRRSAGGRRPAAEGARRHRAPWRPDRMRGRLLRAPAGRGAGDRGRIGLRQDRAARPSRRTAGVGRGRGRPGSWRARAGGRAAAARGAAARVDAHRAGLRQPEPERRARDDRRRRRR